MTRLVELLLYLYPRSFRRAHGGELLQVARTAHRRGDLSAIGVATDMLIAAPREWLRQRGAANHYRHSRPRGSVMHDLFRDIRYASRLLIKSPGFTAAAVITLALGIGANTAMFSLADATLLRPLKVAAPERLVSWTWASAYPDYVAYAGRADVFDGVMAWAGGSRVSVVVDEASELTSSIFVSGNTFDLLGVNPAAGRLMLPSDDVRNNAIVGVLSHDYWRARFGGDAGAVGRLIRVNGQAVTIIGVAQEGFRGVTLGSAPSIYLPVTASGIVRGGFFNRPEIFETRNFVWLNVIARLRDGVAREQASSAIDTMYRQLNPLSPGETMAPLTLDPLMTRALGAESPDAVQRFVVLLLGVVALTLLIGCANLANLLLAKSAARRHEVGIRLAIGATRGHVARQLVVESVLLAAIGGAAGLAVAAITLRVLSTYELPGGIGIETLGLSLDRWTLGATAALSLLTGLLFGAMPAWRASRTDVMVTLRDETRGTTSPSRVRGALVAAQVALSLVLLVGSGLFLRSLVHALSVPLGFNVEGVATASVNAGLVRYDAPRARAFYADALPRVRQLPGVTAAAWASMIPSNGAMMNVVDVQGYVPAKGEDMSFYVSQVGPEYFSAVGSRVLSGRAFTAADNAGAGLVAIVSQTAVDKFWGGRNPLGAQMRPGGSGAWRTIVGVVEDVKAEGLSQAAPPFVFYPFEQETGGIRGASQPAHLLVRTTGDPRETLGPLAAQLRAVDPQMPVYDVMPFDEHVRELVMPQRMGAILLGFFSLLAVSLASIGIYGVASYVAQLRTRELGIRIALGANAREIRGIVVRHGVTPAAIGVAIGLALAVWAARFVRAFLYDVSPADPLTFAVVSVALLLVAIVATWLPARRAARLDPIAALRHV